jgi:hypothetical protein
VKRTELQRGDYQLKRSPMRKRRPKPLTVSQREKQVAWHRGAAAKHCASCGSRHGIEGHHVIRVQVLRREALARGFDFERARWDPRNRLPLCSHCHAAHHGASRRLSLSLLWKHAPKVFQFARELGLSHVLTRDYAPVERSAA